jgi:epoxyqueuosine reductase QueG
MQKGLVIKEITRFVKTYPEQAGTRTKWKRPVVGFADAEDPLFLRLKEVVRPSHALPQDLLPTARTVVAYFLPFESKVQRENAQEPFYPSRSWAVAYQETNRLISVLGDHMKEFFKRSGYQTVSTPATHNYDQEILLSDWSHRHVGFVAGLGRFGLNRWLITEKGCCGRLGSFVTEARFSPTPRPQTESCLHRAGYECRACVERCIYDALFLDRFDRHACNRHLLKNDAYFSDLQTTDVCGKCGCGLPCSSTNPVRKRSLDAGRRSRSPVRS